MNRLTINGIIFDIDNDVKVTHTIQATDIGKPDEIKSNYTYSIPVKLTPKNRNSLRLLNLPAYISERTEFDIRDRIPATYEEDGQILFGDSSFAVVNEINEFEMKISLYSGNFDIMQLLKNIKLADFDFDNPIYNLNVVSTLTPADGIFFPVCDYRMEDTTNYIVDSNAAGEGEVDIRLLYPAVTFRHMFEKIREAVQDYYLLNDQFPGDFESRYMTVISREGGAAITEKLKEAKVQCDLTQNLNTNSWYTVYFATVVQNYNSVFTNSSGTATWYRPPRAGEYNFRIRFAAYSVTPGISVTLFLRVLQYSTDSSSWEEVKLIMIGGKTSPFDETIDTGLIALQSTENVKVEIRANNVGSRQINIRDVSTWEVTDGSIPVTLNYPYPINENLPDMTAFDFLKFLTQIYACTCNTRDRVFDIIPIQSRWDNLILYDYSDKLIGDLFEKEYIDSTKGKKNWIKYKTDKVNAREDLGNEYFEVIGAEQPEATFYDLIFAASENQPHFVVEKIAKIRMFANGALQGRVMEPHFGIAKLYERKMRFKTASTSVLKTSSYLGYFPESDTLYRLYEYITFICQDYLKAKAYFRIGVQDIGYMDMIYLKQTGRYWCVNKLEKMPNGIYKAELIKMI